MSDLNSLNFLLGICERHARKKRYDKIVEVVLQLTTTEAAVVCLSLPEVLHRRDLDITLKMLKESKGWR